MAFIGDSSAIPAETGLVSVLRCVIIYLKDTSIGFALLGRTADRVKGSSLEQAIVQVWRWNGWVDA